MRKYIIGTLFGLFLATAAGANAQEVTKLIDSVVQGVFPVTVEGNSVGDAIVVNDKTYLPVREFGEAVGYKVTFTEDREVVLTKTEESKPNVPITTPIQNDIPQKTLDEQITELNEKLKSEKSNLESNKLFKQQYENLLTIPNAKKESIQKSIDDANQKIADSEKRIADYEAQIAALEAQK
jgi:hypothetical protein